MSHDAAQYTRTQHRSSIAAALAAAWAPTEPSLFAAWVSHCKERVELDLRDASDLQILDKLLNRADVLVEVSVVLPECAPV